jgi:hypothetical protein
MEGLIEGRVIHVVLDASYGANAGQHRSARISQVVDAEKGLIATHIDLLPGDHWVPAANHAGTDWERTGFLPTVPYSEGKEPGSWHWLEHSHSEREHLSRRFRGWMVKDGHGFTDTDHGLIDSRLIVEDLGITDSTQARMIAEGNEPAVWPPKLQPVKTPLRHLFPLPSPRHTESEESDEKGNNDHV